MKKLLLMFLLLSPSLAFAEHVAIRDDFNALSEPASVPASLWARFQACSTNIERHGYDIY